MDTIWVGDTFPVSVEWTRPDVDNPAVTVDVNPTSAVARVVRARRFAVLVDDAEATVDGNATGYLVAAEHTTAVGEYRCYITATFADGTVRTDLTEFCVRSKS